MSDVDTVPSLPAVLDVGKRVLVAEVNDHKKLSGSRSPRAASPQFPAGREDVLNKVDLDGHTNQSPSPKADSEAETIIQSGRESLSPEKRRKYIRHETEPHHARNDHAKNADPSNDSLARKRKWVDDETHSNRARDIRSDSPTSTVVKMEKLDASRPGSNQHCISHSGTSGPKSEGDHASRKRSFSEAVEVDLTRSRRGSPQRSSVAPGDRTRGDHSSASPVRPASNDRSVSPAHPSHKRTASGPPHTAGDLRKKKRAPPPFMTDLQRQSSEDRQSVSSSASGSPLPSARLRRLGATDHATASPAKHMGHKKQRDQNGRTRLARACAAQELETAMARHAERPEDLNVADNAGNTPLQIAALEGCAPIVRFLVNAGCEVNTKNIDKDTPLIDAVENGHLEVVKILLEAGANPRIVNAEGDEPYELVPSDADDYEEIRRVLAEAKANPKSKRRSEERSGQRDSSSSRRASAASPRESPPAHGTRSPPAFGSVTRRKTVRSEATRNDLLWTKATPENLREFAAKGDIAGVANILNVGQKADPESLIAAAKGGHDEVLSLLLGMGDADPDPNPVQGGVQKAGYNTPMLAAIGRGNLEVIKLLLAQPGFNPTRRLYHDRTYFELSRERKGEDWEEEYDLLHDAYVNYIKSKKTRKAELSSPHRSRDKEKEKEKASKRSGRRTSPSPASRPRKAAESPSGNHRRSTSSKDQNPKERRRDGIHHSKEIPVSNRSRSRISDKETSPEVTRLESPRRKARDGEINVTTRNDEVPRRRRLIAGRPPQDRDKRRPSLMSSDSLSGKEEVARKHADNASDTVSAKPPLKRVRVSVSPETSHHRWSEPERHSDEQHKKRRRVLSEDAEHTGTNGRRKSQSLSADDLKQNSPKKEHNSPDSKQINPRSDQGRANDAPVKEEREKHESHDLDDIPMEDADKSKKAETDSEVRKREEAKKFEEDRIVEKRLAADAERARIVKEETERAARLARERADEEERRRKEAEQRRVKQAEDERQKRLDQERHRLARQRREQEEQEQRRRDALPDRLRIAANLVGSNDPRARSHAWLKKFMPLVTAQTKQLDPSCGPELADEKWVPNYLVAPLLATNDLQLRQYASWEKRKATATQRMNLWRVTRRILVQADDAEFLVSSFGEIMQKDFETRPKYFEMEHVFWVKLSDFMDIVPHVPHLHGLNIQFLRMHIDAEPPASSSFSLPQPNGHFFGGPIYLEDNNNLSAKPNGIANGYGHPRPSTYV